MSVAGLASSDMAALEELGTLFGDVASGNNDRIQNATTILKKYAEEPSSIWIFLEFVSGAAHTPSVMLGVILLRKCVVYNKQSFGLAEICEIRSRLIQSIARVTNLSVVYNICEVLSLLNTAEDCYGDIPEYALSLLHESTNVECAFYLLHSIYQGLQPEYREQLCQSLFPVCLQCLTMENVEIRTQVYRLLIQFLWNDEDCPVMAESEELAQHINNALKRIVTLESISEAKYAIDFISQVIRQGLACMVPYHRDVFITVVQGVVQSSLSTNVRILLLDVITACLTVSVDVLTDDIPDAFDALMQFSTEMCLQDPDSEDFKVFDEFLRVIVDVDYDGDIIADLFPTFFGSAIGMLEMSENEAQVGLAAIQSLVSSSPTEAAEYEDELIGVVKTALMTENPNIVSLASDVIIVMSSTMSENMTRHLDTLSKLLLPHCLMIKPTIALQALFENSTLPPSNLGEVLQVLVDTIAVASVEVKEELLEAVCGALTNAEEVDESFFEGLLPTLSHFLEGDVVQKGKAIRTFGFLAKISPNSLKSFLDSIFNALSQLFSDNNYDLNGECCTCIAEISAVLPKKVEKYLSFVFTQVRNVLSLTLVDEEVEVEEEDDEEAENRETRVVISYHKMKAIALDCLGSLCSHYPTQLGEYLGEVCKQLQPLISSADPYTSKAAIQSYVGVATGYKAINASSDEIVTALLNSMNEISDVDILAELWSSLGLVLNIFGRETVERRASEIQLLLSSVFSKTRNIYNQKGNSKEIRIELQSPVFYVLNTFITELAGQHPEYTDTFIQSLTQVMNTSKKTSKSKATYSLMLLISYSEHSSLFESVVLSAMSDLNSKSPDSRTSALSTLNLAVRYSPEAMESFKMSLFQVCTEIIQDSANGVRDYVFLVESAASLWFSLVSLYAIPVPESVVSIVYGTLQYRANSEDLKYLADTLPYFNENYRTALEPHLLRIACTVLSSDEPTTRTIKPDSLHFLRDIARSAHKSEIKEIVCYNQANYANIQRQIT